MHKNGQTQLFKACRNGLESIVQLLLDSGADINLNSDTGASSFPVACAYGLTAL